PGSDDHLHVRLARELGRHRQGRFGVDGPPVRSPRQEAVTAALRRPSAPLPRALRQTDSSGAHARSLTNSSVRSPRALTLSAGQVARARIADRYASRAARSTPLCVTRSAPYPT